MNSWVQERILGTGSFGIVTLWKNDHTNQRLALKQCRLDLQNNLSEEQKKRWRNEIEIMVKLNHSNIVQAMILPRYLSNMLKCSVPILCMEFCSRGDLRQTLNQSRNCCGLTETEVRCVIPDIKNALNYLHQLNIIHRDIKPENILLQESFGKILYKLTDLGYAKELKQDAVCSSFVGTLQYVAPELFLGGTYDKSVDYWSFGLVCHEVITGIRPFIPQSSPAVWINYVKVKRREHICIYQSTNGYVRYSSRLFSENQISLCFQHLLEQWLQNALEWDYKKRGVPDSIGDNLFTQVDVILNKRILKLYCSVTNSYLSYEVDQSTAISTLLGWIERDTKLKPESQILLSYLGVKIDNSDFAINYYVKNKDIVIYVYDLKPMHFPRWNPTNLPGLVLKMMENPLGMLDYFYLKRTVAQSVHYIQNQYHLHSSFWTAYEVRRSYVDKISQNISSLSANILMEMNKMLSNRKMCEKILKFDVKCCCYLFDQMWQNGHSEAIVSRWQNQQQSIAGRINELLTVYHDLKMKYDEILREYSDIDNFVKLKKTSIFQYEECLKSIYKCYENLPKSKEKLSTPVEAMKIVRDFLNCRNILTNNSDDFSVHSQKLHEFEGELRNLENDLLGLKRDVFIAKSDVLSFQFNQRKDVWKLLANSFAQNSPVEAENLNISKQSFGISTLPSNEDSGFVDQANVNVVKSANETDAILSDNENLRHELLNNLKEIIRKYRVMKDESESIDWTFLKADERNN